MAVHLEMVASKQPRRAWVERVFLNTFRCVVCTVKEPEWRTLSWLGQTRLPFESPEGLEFPCIREPGKTVSMSNTHLNFVVVVVVGAILGDLSLCAALHGVDDPFKLSVNKYSRKLGQVMGKYHVSCVLGVRVCAGGWGP